MKFEPSFIGIFLASIGTVSGWLAWWIKNREQAIQKAVALGEKNVNDKRDFNHLVTNQIEISKNITHCFEDLEHQVAELDKQVREIKAYLIRNQNNANAFSKDG